MLNIFVSINLCQQGCASLTNDILQMIYVAQTHVQWLRPIQTNKTVLWKYLYMWESY